MKSNEINRCNVFMLINKYDTAFSFHQLTLFHYFATKWHLSALLQTHVSPQSRCLRAVGTAVQQVSECGRVDGEDSVILTHQPQTLIFTDQSCVVVLWKTGDMYTCWKMVTLIWKYAGFVVISSNLQLWSLNTNVATWVDPHGYMECSSLPGRHL